MIQVMRSPPDLGQRRDIQASTGPPMIGGDERACEVAGTGGAKGASTGC